MFNDSHMYPYSFKVRGFDAQQAVPGAVAAIGRGGGLLAQTRLGRLGATNLAEKTAVGLPVDWMFLAGGAGGAALSGAAIGYFAGGSTKAAATGAIAGSGIWASADAVRELFLSRYALGGILGVAGVGALAYAWFRKPK